MTDLFRQVTDEETGEVSYERVEVDEIVTDTERYKNVLDESITRRHKIKDLNSEIEELKAQLSQREAAKVSQTEEKEQNPAKEVQQAKPAQPQIDLEQIKREVLAELQKAQEEQKQAEQKRQNLINESLEKYKLPSEFSAVLAQIPEESVDAVASTLASKQFRFDDVSGGATPSDEQDLSSVLSKVYEKLNLS